MSQTDSTLPVVDGTEGLGTPLPTPIETLPPIEQIVSGVPVSPATGQPRRHPVMIVANVFLYAAAAIQTVALGMFWWRAIHMETFPTSAHLIEMVDPRPGSAASVFAVIGVMVMGVVTVAASSISAFNSWNGHRWSRVGAIVATVLACLAYFLHPWAWYAVPFAAIGAIILWLPPVTRYFENWRLWRNPDKPAPEHDGPVLYGPMLRMP